MAANQLLESAWAGSNEILGVLDDQPLLVVEIESGDDVPWALPPWLPCVVVAVAHGCPVTPAPAGADVAVCPDAGGQMPPGWVGVADPDGELRRLSADVGRAPQPSVFLAQLLRLSTERDVERGLLVESLAYSTLQAGPAFSWWLAGRRRTTTRVRDEPEQPVLVNRDADHLIITLNRPHVRNAVNARLRDALAEALLLAGTGASGAQVELHGAGPDFSSGGDLDEFGSFPDVPTAHLVRTVRSPARLLAGLGERVTAHLHGACVGAGIELAAFARTVVASPDTRCRLPEVSLGLVPGSGGTVSIPRRIGRHRAAWLGLSGETIDVETAAQWGLVDRILPTSVPE
ncbi:MAG TPA: enoyl-CoA hydratase/isomerase family protein [Acidimicrobiales bacterium]|nr:enoyl-CoA hydratase/isomerase family protein [Acidimicrobiales bacterium]